MSGLSRRFLVALCFCGVFAGLVAWCLILALRGKDRWSLVGPDEAAGSEWQCSEDLEAQRLATLERVKTKLGLAVEVAEGRLGLLVAAGRFRGLDRQWPVLEPDPRRVQLGATDEEHYCRSVIAAVRTMLYERPDIDSAVIERLDAELRGYLKRSDLQLPDR